MGAAPVPGGNDELLESEGAARFRDGAPALGVEQEDGVQSPECASWPPASRNLGLRRSQGFCSSSSEKSISSAAGMDFMRAASRSASDVARDVARDHAALNAAAIVLTRRQSLWRPRSAVTTKRAEFDPTQYRRPHGTPAMPIARAR